MAIAYIVFDVVPAPKGAAIHIAAFAQQLAARAGALVLVTVAPEAGVSPPALTLPGVELVWLPARGATLIQRVLDFRAHLRRWLAGRRFAAIQFRSPYEGWVLALEPGRYAEHLIFEVNGLPSLELKYRYPEVADDRELMQKLWVQEQRCLQVAAAVLTPSPVTRDYLLTRGVPAAKLTVIPNGVDLDLFRYQAPRWRSPGEPLQLLYFGILAAWQGVDLAVRAVALVAAKEPVGFTVIGRGTRAQVQALERLAAKLGIGDRVCYRPPVPQAALLAHLHAADATLVPLALNDRNLVQGCCPLKLLESMAAGRPAIASDLPVTRALGRSEREFLLVKPGAVQPLADAILRLAAQPALGQRLAAQARQWVEAHYTWERAGAALAAVYQELETRPGRDVGSCFGSHDRQDGKPD